MRIPVVSSLQVKFLLFVFSLILLPSCTKVHVNSNAIADKKYLPVGFRFGNSFTIVSLNQHDNMLSKEVSEKIATILENKGFIVNESSAADYCLVFNFDMNSSSHIRYIPIYSPGKTTVTHGTVYNTRGYGGGYQETSKASDTITYIPQEYTLFHRRLNIEVYDMNLYMKAIQGRKDARSWTQQISDWLNGTEIVLNEGDVPKIQVWQGRTVSSGESSDFRSIINYLLVAVFEHFGRDTRGEVTRAIGNNDKEAFSLLCKGRQSFIL